VFHASAVESDGRGIAFMGASGRGKSTLAAAFAARGRGFLCDDGLLVGVRRARPWIMPSPPALRLWEDSRAAVLAGVEGTPAPYSAKVHLLGGEGVAHCARPLPLHHVYFLGAGRARGPSIQALPKGEALIELVRHSFLMDVEAGELLAAHFESLTRVARGCAFFRLDYPRRFASLPMVREAIAEHARAPSPRIVTGRAGA
jgi:hypothetical protein